MIEGLVALKLVGSSLFGWGLGKFCDKSIIATHEQIQNRLKDKGLDPDHDIERAVLTAHYEALQFIIEHAFSREDDIRVEAYSNRLKTTRKIVFPKVFKSINDPKLENLPTEMAGDWQTIIPTTFEPAAGLADVHKAMPQAYIAQAETDLLNLAGWSDVEEQALKQWIADPNFGWVPSFSACLRRQIKVNEPFYKIFSATNQQNQLRALTSIEEKLTAQLAPNKALSEAMSRVELFLQEFREENREAHSTTHQYSLEILEGVSDILAFLQLRNENFSKNDYVKKISEKQQHIFQSPANIKQSITKEETLYSEADNLQQKFKYAAHQFFNEIQGEIIFYIAKGEYLKAMVLSEKAAYIILPIQKSKAIDLLKVGVSLRKQFDEVPTDILKETERLLRIALFFVSIEMSEL